MNWYYADAGKPVGPISEAEFQALAQSGKIAPDTLVWREGMANWQPYRQVAAPAPPDRPPRPAQGPPPGSPEDLAAIATRDYSLDIGRCLSRSWELVKGNLWPVIGATLLVFILAAVWNEVLSLFTRSAMTALLAGLRARRLAPVPLAVVFLGSLAGSLLYGILYGGLYLFYLKLIRGQPVDPGTVLAGFGPQALSLLLGSLVVSALTMVGTAFCVLPGIYLSVSWLFTFPLIIDKRMDFWPAMELSRKLVTRHWWMVFALAVVAGLIALAGAIACCVGILVTMPVAIGALMFAYEDIFGSHPA